MLVPIATESRQGVKVTDLHSEKLNFLMEMQQPVRLVFKECFHER